MTKATALSFEQPSEFSPDPLTEVIQSGAKELLRTAVQAEVSAFVAEYAHCWMKKAASVWCGTGFCLNVR